MCGIAGFILNKKIYSDPLQILNRMLNPIGHRGPDSRKIENKDNFFCGINRLRIVDIRNDSQPFISPNGRYRMVCNGEILNYRELTKEHLLESNQFSTQSDIEVAFQLFLQKGEKFVDYLKGQFAIAIHDSKMNKVILVRDRSGICPLYYAKTENAFYFASEIKSLLQVPDIRCEVNMVSVDSIFVLPAVPDPNTIFKGINSIKPGTQIRYSNRMVDEKCYWDLDYSTTDLNSEGQLEVERKLEENLVNAVRRRLTDEVDFGIYLSGGIDSSLIAAIARNIYPENRDLKTYSIAFPELDSLEFNEEKYQSLIARAIGSNHTSIPMSNSTYSNHIESVIFHSETLLRESYNVCTYILSKKLKEDGVKVAICGEGADEIFGGYLGYLFDQKRDKSQEFEDFICMRTSVFKRI